MATLERIKAKLEASESLTPDEGWMLWYAIGDAHREGKREGQEQMRRAMREDELCREIVAQLAAMDDQWFVGVESDPDGVPDSYPCPHCGVDLNPFAARHKSECPVTQARALLGITAAT